MNLFALCLLVVVAGVAALGTRKVRMPTKAGHFVKGKPFTLELYVEKGHVKKPKGMTSRVREAKAGMKAAEAAKSKAGWLSGLRGLRRPKTKTAAEKARAKRRFGIFGKEMIEGSGFMNGSSPVYEQEALGESSAQEPITSGPHANETIYDGVQSRVFGGFFFKYGAEVLRPMVHMVINGKRYKMMFDTGSTMSMVPQKDCNSDPIWNFLCFLEPLYWPPPNDNPNLQEHHQGYLGHLDEPDRFVGFTGKVRGVVLTLGNYHLTGSVTTAHTISEIEYPMFGASPSMAEPNLPYLLLHQMAEPRKWFTVLIAPVVNNAYNGPTGLVVFGDIDRRRCSPHITWMADNTSSDLGLYEPGLVMWTAVLESLWIDDFMLRQQYSADFPMYGKTDTGGPSFIFFSEAYNAVIAYLGLVPQQGKHNLPCTTRFTITLRVRNADNTETLDIRVHSQHLLYRNGLDAPNDCTLLIEDGGANSYFTFGFALFRSVCVVHDFDNFRMGFAPFRPIPPPAPAIQHHPLVAQNP